MEFIRRVLLRPVSDAASALARLDEQIARSPDDGEGEVSDVGGDLALW